MRILRSLLSGLIIILLVMTISGMITARAVGSLVGDPNSDAGSQSTEVMSDVLREAIVVAIGAAMSDGSLGWSLPKNEVEAAVRARLRDHEMTYLTLQFTGAFKTMGSGEKIGPGEVVLELGGVRDAAFGGVKDLVHAKVAALPVCTAQQGASMAANPPQGMPECRSSDPAVNTAMVDQAFDGARAVIPDRVDLGEIIGQMGDQFQEQVGAGGQIPSLPDGVPDLGPLVGLPLWLMWFLAGWGYFALFGLIAALVLINLDTWHAQFGRVGWAALLGAGFPLVGSALAIHYLPTLIAGVEETHPSFEAISRLAYELVMIPLLEIRTISFIITLIGVAGLIVAVVGRMMTNPRRSSPKAA